MLGIRNFIVNFIIESSKSEESLRTERAFLNKLNLVLVSILKQEWPHNWPTFINEIVSSCHTSLSICENNMVILRLLSEEVFDFSQDQMTSVKARNLKTSMTQEFSSIFQLCSEVLGSANQTSLVKATLETLLRFLSWIPLGYIFETPIIETLLTRFLDVPDFRNVTLKCLTEIGGLPIGAPYNYDERLVHMFTETLTTVSKTIPLSMDLRQIYAKSNSRDQEFVLNLALFLCSFFSAHLNVRSGLWMLPLVIEELTNPARLSRSCQTGITLRMPTSTLSASAKSMTGKFSRSAWSIGQDSSRSCTRRCSSSP